MNKNILYIVIGVGTFGFLMCVVFLGVGVVAKIVTDNNQPVTEQYIQQHMPNVPVYYAPTPVLVVPTPSCLTAIEYKAQLKSLEQDQMNAMSSIIGLTNGEPSTILVVPNWQSAMEQQLNILDSSGQRILALKPPRGLGNIANKLTTMEDEIFVATQDIRSAMSQDDMSYIDNAAIHIQNADAYLKNVNAELSDLNSTNTDEFCP